MTLPDTSPDTPCPRFNYTKHQVDEYDIPYESHLAHQPEAEVRYKYVANGAYVIQPSTALAASDAHAPPSTDRTQTPPPPPTTTASSLPRNKILLIQRAAHDSWPGRWEVPGGACDPEDPSILYSVARELWEEAGLKATRIGPLVGGTNHLFVTSTGNLVCRFSFLVDVETGGEEEGKGKRPLQVKLDPNEHQAYVWATEDEVEAGRVGHVELKFTNQQVKDGVLEAFRVKDELDRV